MRSCKVIYIFYHVFKTFFFWKHLNVISFWLKHAVCKRIKGCVWLTYACWQESAAPWYKIHLSDNRFCIFCHRLYIAYVILSLQYTGKSKFHSQLNIPHLSEVITEITIKFLVFLGLLHHQYLLVLYAKFLHIWVLKIWHLSCSGMLCSIDR